MPTLGFGHPLGSINDLATINETHACVFTRLAQPVVKAYVAAKFVSRLLRDFSFDLDAECTKHVGRYGDDPMSVDLSPGKLRSTFNSFEDMLPRLSEG